MSPGSGELALAMWPLPPYPLTLALMHVDPSLHVLCGSLSGHLPVSSHAFGGSAQLFQQEQVAVSSPEEQTPSLLTITPMPARRDTSP